MQGFSEVDVEIRLVISPEFLNFSPVLEDGVDFKGGIDRFAVHEGAELVLEFFHEQDFGEVY